MADAPTWQEAAVLAAYAAVAYFGYRVLLSFWRSAFLAPSKRDLVRKHPFRPVDYDLSTNAFVLEKPNLSSITFLVVSRLLIVIALVVALRSLTPTPLAEAIGLPG